jgi:hypothetical protein
MLNHIRNKVKRNKVIRNKVKRNKVQMRNKVKKDQQLFKLYSKNGKHLMYKLFFTNGKSTRIYSAIELVLKNIKLSAKNHTNYYKTQYIPKCITSDENILLKHFFTFI